MMKIYDIYELSGLLGKTSWLTDFNPIRLFDHYFLAEDTQFRNYFYQIRPGSSIQRETAEISAIKIPFYNHSSGEVINIYLPIQAGEIID